MNTKYTNICFQPTPSVRKALDKLTKQGPYRRLKSRLINDAIERPYRMAVA